MIFSSYVYMCEDTCFGRPFTAPLENYISGHILDDIILEYYSLCHSSLPQAAGSQ